MKNRFYIIMLIVLIISGCEDVFEYSPYETDVKESDKDQLFVSINKLKDIKKSKGEAFSFIAISDSHYHYYELEKAIAKINTLNGIEFVVHVGDMTEGGLLKEFELFSNYINKLNIPLLTCIGNHEYLSSGEKIYMSMFGDYNYSFIYKETRLIFFDATTIESNKQPDFYWLNEQLEMTENPVILFSHIPPRGEQYNRINIEKYRNCILNNNILLSVHGHEHIHCYEDMLKTNSSHLITGSVKYRKLCKITINSDNTIEYKMIPF